MRKLRFVLSCGLLLLVVASVLSCGANHGQLKFISISPAAATGQAQFTATGTYSDGSKVSSLPALWSEGNTWVSSDVAPVGIVVTQSGLASCNPVVGTFTVVSRFPLLCFLFLSASVSSVQQIVGHWKFNEGSGSVAHDSSGRNNEGEIVGAKWTNGPSPGGGALAFRDHATEYPPSAERTYVRVRNSDSLNPIKGFDIAANVYIDPSFSPMFAADIVEKGDGYGCSYRLLITNDFKLEAVAGNEHSALVSSTKLTLGRWFSARATYNGRTLKIYIDGKEDASMAVQTKSLASQDDLIIGRRFTGKLADIVVTAE